MKLSQIALIIGLSALTAFSVSKYTANPTESNPKAKETAFERVMRTNTLRCGYYVFPPVVMRDPNTGKMSGFTVDMMNAIAAKTDLKIEWAKESTFGNWIPALQADRFDAMCAPMWSDMALGREVIFSQPLFYAAIIPLVRENDTRFDGPDALQKLNSPDVTVVAQEGNMVLHLAKEALPKAKMITLPANLDAPTVIQNILTRKADVILLDKNAVIEYNKHNKAKLKMVQLEKPIKAQPFVLPTHKDDTALRDFLNNAIFDMHMSGSIERLLEKWEPEKGTFLRVNPAYQQGS